MSEPDPDNPTIGMAFDVGGEEIEVKLEFHFSDNFEKFLDVSDFVNAVNAAVLRDVMGL
ncbi:hypothetical protein SEA_OLICIOUS_52 [Streptomyces phage Olicious]|uniref:Uncharacterized protein n=7 Tax=Immanueltrevirus immanuel3 TaxID=2846399 RepID=A0A2H5BMI7_9CAUD|nr:hypothetical protein HWB41_gp47 [Streptomyces phage Immanuel3]AUG87357.1 hypothetical protein SEA_HAUGEANATOR_52 [Streptomyces phage HaugeAnator]AUG87421.1 hypothetical protein SEA_PERCASTROPHE_52 [Streptomyces phage Percastrophe]AUG87485.1 hypothetical protein SEA_ROMERO_52 [Streptomyces phage Romero]AUG87549.1 hypothetical protein SEA_TORITOKI_52 [Streptomyces phage ToriToki]AUG87613.1 hypothetical protein SEA_ZOOBEAR_52 [Streptomyces phage ZooBear]AZF95840.1 hypothetical protein SEA_OLI